MRSLPLSITPLRLIASCRVALVGLHILLWLLANLVLTSWLPHRQTLALRRQWSRVLLTLLGIRYRFTAAEHVGDLDQGLLVANHISFVDIFLINAMFPASFVAKDEVRRWPLIGWLVAKSDTIFISRGSRSAAYRARDEIAQRLASGGRVAIFPEGTTSTGEQVLPFHAALFDAAVIAQAEVHCLRIRYTTASESRCEAIAYTGSTTLLECIWRIVCTPSLSAELHYVTTLTEPHVARRELAQNAHQAIGRAP
jgi:1-acyl-sn-glycerol-3-phosphate acyltransferase